VNLTLISLGQKKLGGGGGGGQNANECLEATEKKGGSSRLGVCREGERQKDGILGDRWGGGKREEKGERGATFQNQEKKEIPM